MRRWVGEVGRELRDVESQISFFRRRVESRIRWQEPVGERCPSCRKT